MKRRSHIIQCTEAELYDPWKELASEVIRQGAADLRTELKKKCPDERTMKDLYYLFHTSIWVTLLDISGPAIYDQIMNESR